MHRFETPVAVERQCIVSVRFVPTGDGPGLLAVASADFQNARADEVREQWSDGTGYHVSDAWWGTGEPGSGRAVAHLWVEARVATTTVADEPGAPAASRLAPPAPNRCATPRRSR